MGKTIWHRAPGATLVLCTLLLTGGCAVTQETRQSLAGYVQAMGEVERSANMFVSDFANAAKVQDELKRVAGTASAPRVEEEYPTEFKLPATAAVPQTPEEKAVAATRQALAVVHQYNDALVALAEGHSEQEVKQRTTAFGDALQSLIPLAEAVPGLSAITGIAAKVIMLAQNAANKQQLKEAVVQGREPVNTILSVLEQQTPALYRASVVVTKQAQDTPKANIRRASHALKAMLAQRGPATDGNVGTKWTDAQAQLAEIGARTHTTLAMPGAQPFTGGRPAYDEAAHAETQVFVQSMDMHAQRYVELVAKQKAYYELMVKYVATLREAGQGLDLVAESLSRPVDLRAEVARLLQVAFDLRDAVSAYRHPPTP
jgi:hypothetical protein